jgi:hypothetical protein
MSNIGNYQPDIQRTIDNLKRNNMDAVYFEHSVQALDWVKETLQIGAKVAIGGSNTLRDIGVTGYIEDGDFIYTNRYVKGVPFQLDTDISQEIVEQSYLDAFTADFYLSSSNAVTEEGDLVNVDGKGNRVAALSYGPKKVIVIVGVNKIVRDLPAAFERLSKIICETPMAKQRNIQTPCVKAGHCVDCKVSGRPCGIYSIIRYQNTNNGKNRITVLIVNEDLGF